MGNEAHHTASFLFLGQRGIEPPSKFS
jgi:hypothetical protein